MNLKSVLEEPFTFLGKHQMILAFVICVGLYVNFFSQPSSSFETWQSSGVVNSQKETDIEDDGKYKLYDKAYSDKLYGFGNGCVPTYTKRYMYMPIPPTTNSSHDIRNAPQYINLPDTHTYGIFKHTDIEGNYNNQRLCPQFKLAEQAMA